MKPDQQSEIIRRLRCAAGHLNAVIEMTEAGQPCEQVLHQLNAVQAALRARHQADHLSGPIQSDHNSGQPLSKTTDRRTEAAPLFVYSFHAIFQSP